jgi:hypothetical protein
MLRVATRGTSIERPIQAPQYKAHRAERAERHGGSPIIHHDMLDNSSVSRAHKGWQPAPNGVRQASALSGTHPLSRRWLIAQACIVIAIGAITYLVRVVKSWWDMP